MLVGDFSKMRTSIPFEDIMLKQTKEEAKKICNLFGISIRSNLRKKEYVSLMSSTILSWPDLWLCQLTYDEVLLLIKLVEAGPDTYIKEPLYAPNALVSYGLILIDKAESGDGIVRYMICDELREAIAPFLADLILSEEQLTTWEIERYAYGLLNLYGMIPYFEFVDMLKQEWENRGVSKTRLLDVIASGSLNRFVFEMVDLYETMAYVRSPFLEYPEDLDLQLYLHKGIDTFKSFTKAEIYEAGEMPYPTIPSAANKKLQQFMMDKLQMAEAETRYWMQEIWLCKQSEEPPMTIVTGVIQGKLHSMDEMQSAINLFVEYMNSIPCWFLRGYSSEESTKMLEQPKFRQKPPQLVAGPNMQAMGMDINPGMQKMFDEIFTPEMTASDIGRNDPCPCGSGRKFKHCCGKVSH